MQNLTKILLAVSVLAALAVPASAQETNDRLLIVNANTGHVVYDDGRDDLFCVTRRRIVGHDDDGRRIYRRTMRCR